LSTNDLRHAQIAAFWAAFMRLAPKLAAIESAEDAAYDELLAALHEVDAHLFLEVGTPEEEGAQSELIVTAEGDRALFSLAQQVVARAPAPSGWKFFALKPKLGFPDITEWEGVAVRPAEVRFEPLRRSGSLALGLRLYVPRLLEKDRRDVLSALLRALDSGLGEEQFAERIEHVEVRALPDDSGPDDFTPLLDLERFLAWQEEQTKHLQ
jgi:hypothetical protein